MPKVVRKFINRVPDLNKPPLTYDEARLFQSNVSRPSADEAMKLTPVMKRAIVQFSSDLGDSVSATAQSGGKLEQFQSAMSDYQCASRVQNIHDAVMDAIKEHGLKGPMYGVGTGLGGGILYKVIKDALGK